MKKAVLTILLIWAFFLFCDVLAAFIENDFHYKASITWFSLISALIASIVIFFLWKLAQNAFKKRNKRQKTNS